MATDYREIAELYDFEYPDVDYLGPDVDFFLSRIDARRIVEIGCGTGRATRPIAAAGREVVGFDIDPVLLDIARQKAGGPTYVEADATDEGWPDAVGTGFDAACCFFNTFLAFAEPEEQESCLRGCHAALKPGGVLWLDVFHPNLDLITGAVGGVDELEPGLFATPDGRSILRTTSLYADVSRQIQHVTFNYTWLTGDERHEHSRAFDMAWIMPREMERLLRLCGFELVQMFGDHDGGELDDDSERQIVLARRV